MGLDDARARLKDCLELVEKLQGLTQNDAGFTRALEKARDDARRAAQDFVNASRL